MSSICRPTPHGTRETPFPGFKNFVFIYWSSYNSHRETSLWEIPPGVSLTIEGIYVSWWYYNSGYWSDWSIKLLLLVVSLLSWDVTLIGSFPLKLFSFVLGVFESGHSTNYWGEFGPLLQLILTLKMATAQVVETSVTVYSGLCSPGRSNSAYL